MDISLEVLQEGNCMIIISGRLIIIQDHRLLIINAGTVEPHIGLRLRLFAFFLQHLYRRFIAVDDMSGKKLLPHMFHHRHEIRITQFAIVALESAIPICSQIFS